MACPFFAPDRRLEPGPWTHVPRLPLGDAYSGECHVRPGEPHVPPEEHQREVCNCGYPRGRCDRFPGGDAADAVRFSMTEAGVVYILEKDYAPVAHGIAPENDGLLSLQARAFVESYRRRRDQE